LTWKPILAGDLAVKAVEVARSVAARLCSQNVLAAAIEAARTQTGFPRIVPWIPYSVAQGYSGLALLWGYLDRCFPAEHWDKKGHEALEIAVSSAESYQPSQLSLFSGLSGLAFAAWQLSRGGQRYHRLLAQLDETIAPAAIASATTLRDQQDGVNVGDFDAISGLSGVGAYLLCRCCDLPLANDALRAVLTALASLMKQNASGIPRWHTPPAMLYDDEIRAAYPFGNLNLGLAHGLPSVIALLSLCKRQGLAIDGLTQALEYAVQWICEKSLPDNWGINWPTAVQLEEVNTGSEKMLRVADSECAVYGPSRCAWCYGAPGIARALWLAGDALGRSDYHEVALEAMSAVFRRPVEARAIPSPTFCHGIAGLLQIALRFANDTRSPEIAEQSRDLTRQLLEQYSPDSLLGFRNLEVADREVDQPGLLDGAPGVALALLAAASEVEPTWDRLFLLS
jgi:hypothetical protein